MSRENLAECKPVSFAHLEIKERADLQHVLRDHIEVLDSDLRVIAEEYGNWEDSRRRIDLLALDKQQRLVVIELKRTETGGHMDLQALRYAAMASAMTFEQVIDAHEAYLAKRGLPDAGEAAERIREFLELPPDEDAEISSDVRILLVSGDFSREITTTVLWLNGFERMDIRCVQLVAYEIAGKNYLDIEQVIPLPQTVDYQIQIGKKAQQQKRVREGGADWTRYQIVIDGEPGPPLRKRQAMLTMIRTLHQKGVGLDAISKHLPPSRLRVIPARLEDSTAIEEALRAQGVNEPERYFLDAPFTQDGKTYVLSKMWGRGTVPVLSTLRDAFAETGVSFQAEE